MKKIIISIIILVISNINVFANNYIPNNKDKLIINKLSYKIEKLLDNQSLSFRENLKNKINTIQQKYKNNKKMYYILEEVKKNNYLIDNSKEFQKHYKDNKINFYITKQNWLNWHNQIRKKLGEGLYSYDNRLNNTAFTWSKKQNEIGQMTHERNKGDGFYNYKKIEKWFNKRGIKCKAKGGVTSSESIARYGYYCNSNDCTNELNKSLKKIFDIYISEKGLKYPNNAHYLGIVNPNLSKIGLGLFITEDKNDSYKNYKSYNYYLTTHYCSEFKK